MGTLVKMRLRVLTPLHIGCGEDYEPFSFVLDESRAKLIEFTPEQLSAALAQNQFKEFSEKCAKGTVTSIVEIYKLLARYAKQIKGREIDVVRGLVPHYKKVASLSDEKIIKKELNNFAINRTAFNPHTRVPYIPGSSVKGALRTAYLNLLAKREGTARERWKRAGELEGRLFGGSFSTDPFRMVKVSDFIPSAEARTRIVYAVNKKKKHSKFEAQGPVQIFESVQPGTTFEGTIMIEKSVRPEDFKLTVDKDDLFDAAETFYGKILADDSRALRNAETNPRMGHDSGTIIRLGRHSGAEAVTIEGHRDIKIMQGRGKPTRSDDHASTIWLASEEKKPGPDAALIPFGWAELMPVGSESSSDWYPYKLPKEYMDGPIKVESDAERSKAPPVGITSETVVWKNAMLKYMPNNGKLAAECDNRKAVTAIRKEDIPPEMHKALFEKKNAVKADVVIRKSGNLFEIIAVKTPEKP